MIIKKKICASCNKESYIFSRKMCQKCWAKNYKNPIKKVSKKGIIKKIDKKNIIKQDFQFYIRQWNKSERICFECTKSLGLAPNICNFHHIIPKQEQHKYSIDIRHNPDNIVMLCKDCHNQVEINIDKTNKVKELTIQTKEIFQKWRIKNNT